MGGAVVSRWIFCAGWLSFWLAMEGGFVAGDAGIRRRLFHSGGQVRGFTINPSTIMPLTTNGSYLTTADTFITHWTDANALLDPLKPVVTSAGVTLADLITKRTNVSVWFDEVTAAINQERLTRATLASHQEYVRTLCVAFNEAVRGRLANTSYAAALPLVVGTRSAPEDVVSNARDVENLWNDINDDVPMPGLDGPLTIPALPMNDPDGDPISIDRAAFIAEFDLLKTAVSAYQAAQLRSKKQRDNRDREKRRLSNIMRDYRAAIPGFFAPGDPIRESLPDLYPAPGHTPQPVVATGTWDVAAEKGKITFTPSEEPTLARYVLRYSPGEEYSTEDDITLGNVVPGEPLEFFTLAGLAAPGDTGLFRVYVVLQTGNEKGSNTVTLTRPPA